MPQAGSHDQLIPHYRLALCAQHVCLSSIETD